MDENKVDAPKPAAYEEVAPKKRGRPKKTKEGGAAEGGAAKRPKARAPEGEAASPESFGGGSGAPAPAASPTKGSKHKCGDCGLPKDAPRSKYELTFLGRS